VLFRGLAACHLCISDCGQLWQGFGQRVSEAGDDGREEEGGRVDVVERRGSSRSGVFGDLLRDDVECMLTKKYYSVISSAPFVAVAYIVRPTLLSNNSMSVREEDLSLASFEAKKVAIVDSALSQQTRLYCKFTDF
jgi:hypothetical protein